MTGLYRWLAVTFLSLLYVLLNLLAACESLVDPVMASKTNLAFWKVKNTWNKLTRYQHHLCFLERCLQNDSIPKGLVARLHMNLVPHDLALQDFCKNQLLQTSREITTQLLSSVKQEVSRLRNELLVARTEAFKHTDYRIALGIWFYIRDKIGQLRNNLKFRENRKMSKVIDCRPSTSSSNLSNASDQRSEVNLQREKRNRRFDKAIRRLRKRQNRNLTHSTVNQPFNNVLPLDLNPINLTSQELTEDQTRLLRKGPSFCPLPKDINWLKLQDDWEKFERRMRLKAFFHQKRGTEGDQDQAHSNEFKPPSTKTWNPPKSKHPELELFLSEVKKGIFNPANINHPRDNLTKKERLALKELKSDSERIIRIQDKGSRFVLISRKDYTSKMLDQLQNPLHSRQLSLNPSDDHLNIVQAWCDKWLSEGQISQEIAEWVGCSKAKPGVAYGNVKTHKPNNPLRLITSCRGTAIERLSEFTEFYLKPLAQKLPSFIKDTTHLLQKIEQVNDTLSPLPPHALLVSWDIVSMFPNIDNNLGLTAVKCALDTREIQAPATDCILEAVELCLKHNNSQFVDNHYLQTHGTAMGPRNACSYADLAMGHIDHLAKTGGDIHPTFWWRYRDDIIDIWLHGQDKLLKFTEYINSLYPTIKFELVVSHNQLNVLDLTLHLDNGVISTDTYSKPTDSHLYLAPTSAHPSHCIKAIPYNVALRLKRNCSFQYLPQRNEEYKSYLVQQGYKASLVNTQFNKVATLDRQDLVKPAAVRAKRKVTPLVVDYNPNMPDIGRILRDNIHILHSTPLMRNIFPDKSIIPAFRSFLAKHVDRKRE